MSESDAKKDVKVGNLRGVALDHMTVANAERTLNKKTTEVVMEQMTAANAARVLRNKTANLSVTGATTRLSSVTAQVGEGPQKPQASSTTEAPRHVPTGKKK